MLPRKIFEILHTVMAILVLFEQFSGKFCLYFWSLILSASPNMMHFVRAVLIMRAKRLRHIVMKRFEIMAKFYSSKALLKMAGGRGCIPHISHWIRLCQ